MTDIMHPGGVEITRQAFDLCGMPESAKVLDIGCGHGETAAFLISEYGYIVTGLDKSEEAISIAQTKHPAAEFSKGDGLFLDYDSNTFDCVLMECSLSLMDNPAEAIHEAFCVLKQGGRLIVHDLYLVNPSAEDLEVNARVISDKTKHGDGAHNDEHHHAQSGASGALIIDDLKAVMNEVGFDVIIFEDRKKDLENYAAALILSGKSMDDLCSAEYDKSKLSYFLLIAKKVE